MKVIFIFLLALVTTAHAQQINPVPDYIFRNQMSVGRNAATDSMAYFSVGPRYGAVKGMMPPMVVDTATVTGAAKRNGLLIFSVQKNKYLYWDSVRVQWSDMAGSSGAYITGTGIINYIPQFTGLSTVDTSALYSVGNRLGIGTTNFSYNSTNSGNIEVNGTAGGLIGFKRNDSARGYLWHTGTNMELANTFAGNIDFNTNSTTRGRILSDGTWRLHNLSGAGDRVVTASSNGTLSATTSVTGAVDTFSISTRAWRQKAVDSLQANINAKGSGTVTSVATGYGINGGTITTTGTLTADTLNLSTRAWRQKGIDSVASVRVGGSGITGYIPKWTATKTQDTSQLFQSAGFVAIGNVAPSYKLDITGTLRNTTGAAFATSSGNVLIGTTTDGGAYKLDVQGALRNTTGANFATTSGNVGIGTTSTNSKLEIKSGVNYNESLVTGAASGLLINNAGQEISIGGSGIAPYPNYIQSRQSGIAWPLVLNPLGGNVGIGNTSPSEKLHVSGRIRATTIDSTATGMNMLYADANGVIKKAAALSVVDDVMTASGSWVATKDAGSGVTINNVAYTTNGTTKMMTIDGSFYIPQASFTESAWVDIATIPAGYRPAKTVNWNNNFIVSGAEYERADNVDFTGALGWVVSQMRIKDDGTVQINADFDTNSIAAGGTAYILIQFTQSYIIK